MTEIMQKKEILPYVYDFLSVCFHNDIQDEIKSVVLFDPAKKSYASSLNIFFQAKEKSNISLLKIILTDSLKKFESWAESSIKSFSILPKINILVDDIEKIDGKTKSDILQGICIFGKFENVSSEFSIISFSITSLSQNKKMNFLRQLYGYKNIKENKTYSHKGLLEEIGAERLGKNSLLVPSEKIDLIKKLFREFNVCPKIINVAVKG